MYNETARKVFINLFTAWPARIVALTTVWAFPIVKIDNFYHLFEIDKRTYVWYYVYVTHTYHKIGVDKTWITKI